ncbi:hypothetical protein IV102_18575 [bacterium]|nr:hypothetical protein [bacterium]
MPQPTRRPVPLILLAGYDIFAGCVALALPAVVTWRVLSAGDALTGLSVLFGSYFLLVAVAHIAAGYWILNRSPKGWHLTLGVQCWDVAFNVIKLFGGNPAVGGDPHHAAPARYAVRALIAGAWAFYVLQPHIMDFFGLDPAQKSRYLKRILGVVIGLVVMINLVLHLLGAA